MSRPCILRLTGRREPISMSGQGKAAQASYSAGGLVFLTSRIGPKIQPISQLLAGW